MRNTNQYALLYTLGMLDGYSTAAGSLLAMTHCQAFCVHLLTGSERKPTRCSPVTAAEECSPATAAADSKCESSDSSTWKGLSNDSSKSNVNASKSTRYKVNLATNRWEGWSKDSSRQHMSHTSSTHKQHTAADKAADLRPFLRGLHNLLQQLSVWRASQLC